MKLPGGSPVNQSSSSRDPTQSGSDLSRRQLAGVCVRQVRAAGAVRASVSRPRRRGAGVERRCQRPAVVEDSTGTDLQHLPSGRECHRTDHGRAIYRARRSVQTRAATALGTGDTSGAALWAARCQARSPPRWPAHCICRCSEGADRTRSRNADCRLPVLRRAEATNWHRPVRSGWLWALGSGLWEETYTQAMCAPVVSTYTA
jgi:hypothetical protein